MGGKRGSGIRPVNGLEQIFSKRAFKHGPCSQGAVLLSFKNKTSIKERAGSLALGHLLFSEINCSASSFVTGEAVSQDNTGQPRMGGKGWSPESIPLQHPAAAVVFNTLPRNSCFSIE